MDQARKALVLAFDDYLQVLPTPSDTPVQLRSTIACIYDLHLRTHDYQTALIGRHTGPWMTDARDAFLASMATYLSTLSPGDSLLDLLSCVARGLSKQCFSLSPVVITKEEDGVQVWIPFFYWLVKHRRLLPAKLKLREFTERFKTELRNAGLVVLPNHCNPPNQDGKLVTLSLESWKLVVGRQPDQSCVYLTEFDIVPAKHRHQSDLVAALRSDEKVGHTPEDPRIQLTQWLDTQYIPGLPFSRTQVQTTAYTCTTEVTADFENEQPPRVELLQPQLVQALLAVLEQPVAKKRCIQPPQ